MVEARQVHVEHRATRITQTAPVGAAGSRRSPSPVVKAATGTKVQEQQGSSHPVIEQADVRIATPSLTRPSGSASRAWTEMPHDRHALAMATELLRYRPAPDCHDDWLQLIEALIATAGDSTVLSCSPRPRPSLATNEEQDAPAPPPRRVEDPEPWQEIRPCARPHEPRAGPRDEAKCEVALIPVILIKEKINLKMVLHQMMSLILLTNLRMLEIRRKLKIKTKFKIKSKHKNKIKLMIKGKLRRR
ncbi:hypothetical protein D1007_38104 [Hordeum vulgare]|nr:hypothetical protein D1007_38104 [Hordeum vulgare]